MSLIIQRAELHAIVDSIKEQQPETWEAVAAIQHATRLGAFAKYTERDDPEGILLGIIAARFLGITYGDPGPKLPKEICSQCWGTRYVWLGNTWGMEHVPCEDKEAERRRGRLGGCKHECHHEEKWIA